MFMKRKNFKGAALVVLLVVGAVVYLAACKKDIVTPINNIGQVNDYPGYSAEAKAVAKKVMKFKRQLVDRESVARSGLYMPIDSVIWNVEALFNAEYAFSERKYIETVKQNLEFFVDVNENNEAPFEVVAELYDEITDTVRQAYLNDGISSDKSLMAVVVDQGESVGNRVGLKVCVVSGKMEQNSSFKNPVSGPFSSRDCWYYGEYGGTCNDPSVFGDAAEIIEDSINYYYSGTLVPQPGFRNLNFGMFMVALEGGEYVDENGEPYLYFYDVNSNPPLYLSGDLLNYYYTRELEVLLHLLPTDLMEQAMLPMAPTFIEVDILGLMGFTNGGSYYHHNNYVIYGCKDFIPTQELPPLRDLLN